MEDTNNNNKVIEHISAKQDKCIRRNNLIFNYIKKNYPINLYQLSQNLSINYKTISEVVKFLEISKLIKTKIIINQENRAEKQLFLPEIEEREDKDENS